MFELVGESGLLRYVPFAKVDDEQRMVYGVATDETPDGAGEVVDYEATKAAVADWSKWRNVREMHGAKAAGIAEEITLDDVEKSLKVGVKVVDDGAWEKVKEGVYKGFSIGGRVLASVMERAAEGEGQIRRITEYLLNEISLVDRPANPAATFSLVKREETEGETKSEGDPEPEGIAEEALREMVRGLVREALAETGLSLAKDGGIFAGADQVEELRKSLEGLPTTVEGLEKLTGEVVGLDGSLKKMLADQQALVGDVAQVVQAVEGMHERLEIVEKMPAGTGPVLREIGAFGPGALDGQGEVILKGLLADAKDPAVREFIGTRLAEIQIKAAHQQGNVVAR